MGEGREFTAAIAIWEIFCVHKAIFTGLMQHSYLPYDGKFFVDIKLYLQDPYHENIIHEIITCIHYTCSCMPARKNFICELFC